LTGTRLKDRIALITGASRGIGRATAKLLAAEGAHVILIGRKQKTLEAVDDEIKASGGKATLIPLDLERGAAIDPLGPSLYERFGRLDIFIGNAGMLGGLRPLNHIPSKTWDKVLAINLTANWRLIRTLDPLLRLSDAGRVVFVTSYSPPPSSVRDSVCTPPAASSARASRPRLSYWYCDAYPRGDVICPSKPAPS